MHGAQVGFSLPSRSSHTSTRHKTGTQSCVWHTVWLRDWTRIALHCVVSTSRVVGKQLVPLVCKTYWPWNLDILATGWSPQICPHQFDLCLSQPLPIHTFAAHQDGFIWGGIRRCFGKKVVLYMAHVWRLKNNPASDVCSPKRVKPGFLF